jgi:hypothetical protein
MLMHDDVAAVLDSLIVSINVHLEAGNWTEVVQLTAQLYEQAVATGDVQLAELVQDLHWIANDAIAHPLEVVALVQP